MITAEAGFRFSVLADVFEVGAIDKRNVHCLNLRVAGRIIALISAARHVSLEYAVASLVR